MSMPASDPVTSESSVPEPTYSASDQKPKQIAEPIYTYSVSWTWLLVGMICVFGTGGVVGGIYFIRSQDMATKILDVVEDMVKKSDARKEEREQTNDFAVKNELMNESLKLRVDAANLLNNYRQANPGTTSGAVLKKLYSVIESLYEDYGTGTTSLGLQRGEQLSKLAVELSQDPTAGDPIPYHTRLLELEWDRHYLQGIIDRGMELLAASRKAGNPENYDAMRYIAMALYDYLTVEPYNPAAYRLPTAVFPDTMDGLLTTLYAKKPSDIEIAKRYAEFIVCQDHQNQDRRTAFARCASEELRNKTTEVRSAEAKRIIDRMVSDNERNTADVSAAAYLARYFFNARYVPGSAPESQPNPDLLKVLELAPNHSDALILASLDALRLADNAAKNDQPALASEWQEKAEFNLRKTIQHSPSDPLGYQYLGDYLLLIKGEPMQAVAVWDEGITNSNHRGDEELIGRLSLVLLDQKKVDEVREKLSYLERTLSEIRLIRPGDYKRTDDMRLLLNAQLANTEAAIALSKVDAAQRENRPEEVRRLYNIIQSKKGEAMQTYEQVLRNWGNDPNDFVLFLNDSKSVYNILLPEALMQLGDLKLDWNEPDSAARYFERVARIPSPAIQRGALLRLSVARQQEGRLDEAAKALKTVADRYPQDLSVRYAYTTLMFRTQISSNAANMATFDEIEKELKTLDGHRSELPEPWALDIRLIHLGVARANLSNDADTILEAINEATRKFRALEKKSFPPDKEGKERPYMDDPVFVAELVGIYSSLAARSDFDRLLETLREFPEGEDAYYQARINDCLRRDDKEGAVAIIDEASTSNRLSTVKKERFIALLQTLRGENLESGMSFDKVYSQLKTTFDDSPETLKPQAFFLLANMSLDRGDVEQAKLVRDRLEKIEHSEGTMWRYLEVRIMLSDKDPDYVQMRQIQETIVGFRPTWDMAYILRTMIEEQYLAANPDDPETLATLIKNYQDATRHGNNRPEVWQRLASLLETVGRSDDAREIVRSAALKGVMLSAQSGQLPQPYGRMYTQVTEAIHKEDATGADMIAKQCLILAKRRGEKEALIHALNLTLGKVFVDASLFDSAKRHLEEVAKRGGTNVFPLALCEVKAGDVDAGFQRLLDEIDAVPSAVLSLLPTVLVLLAQAQPSESVYTRIDRLMNQIEKGERLTLRYTLKESEDDNFISIGTNRVPSRKIQSFVIRFPNMTENLDPAMIQFFSPEDTGEEE